MKAIITFKQPYYYLKVKKRFLFVSYWLVIDWDYSLRSLEQKYKNLKYESESLRGQQKLHVPGSEAPSENPTKGSRQSRRG